MKAKLTSGEIVELEKDCGCTHHDGPHWLHMDKVAAKLNRKLLDKGNTFGFAKEEAARLHAKELNMTSRGIVELINDES